MQLLVQTFCAGPDNLPLEQVPGGMTWRRQVLDLLRLTLTLSWLCQRN